MPESVVLVGTRKGLWIGRSDSERQHWSWDPPQFLMQEIYATCIDTRGEKQRMLVGATSPHFGPGVFASDDGGRTWSEAVAAPVRFPEELGASVERIWQIQPGTEPGVVYAGTQPSALFRSADGGQSFELVRGLWDHAHRTDDAAASWVSIADGLPSDFGFPIVVHPHRPETVFVFPLTADGERIPPQGQARVWRSDDAGGSWSPSRAGLPDGFYAAVLRDAMTVDAGDPAGLYLGARDGTVYVSTDDAATFTQIASHLPDVTSIRAVMY